MMIEPKNVTTDRVRLREDISDALEKFDEEIKFSAFLSSTPNGSAIRQYLNHERKNHGPEYRFFYDAPSQKADYVAVWAGTEKYPTVIRHTVEKVTPDEAKLIDEATASTLRWSPAQFGWAVAEMQIQSQQVE